MQQPLTPPTPDQERVKNHGYCAENPYRNALRTTPARVPSHVIDERESLVWVNFGGRRYLEAQCKYCGRIARLGTDGLADLLESDNALSWEAE